MEQNKKTLSDEMLLSVSGGAEETSASPEAGSYQCLDCSNTFFSGTKPDTCPLCGKQAAFIKISAAM